MYAMAFVRCAMIGVSATGGSRNSHHEMWTLDPQISRVRKIIEYYIDRARPGGDFKWVSTSRPPTIKQAEEARARMTLMEARSWYSRSHAVMTHPVILKDSLPPDPAALGPSGLSDAEKELEDSCGMCCPSVVEYVVPLFPLQDQSLCMPASESSKAGLNVTCLVSGMH